MFELYISILQFCTILIGLFCLARNGPFLLWLVLGIIIIAAINENILVDNSKRWWGVSRNALYNIYALMDITVWCVIFVLIFVKRKILQILVILCWIVLVIFKILEMFSFGYHILGTTSLICFCSVCILFSIVYFSSIFKADYHNLKNDFAFWICRASVCFHPVFLVNLLTVAYPQYWYDDFSTITFDILQFIAITFYNLFICIAFLFSFYKSRRSFNQTL